MQGGLSPKLCLRECCFEEGEGGSDFSETSVQHLQVFCGFTFNSKFEGT